MVQKVNGETILTKVLDYADRATVEQAIVTGQSIRLAVASYSSYIERTGVFELVDIDNLHDMPNGAFTFNGRIVSIKVEDGGTGEFKLAAYAELGAAHVVVDKDGGARIDFVVTMSVEFM